MLRVFSLLKEEEADPSYQRWLSSKLEEARKEGFHVDHPSSSQEALSWLRKVIPPLVFKTIICARAVKSCNLTTGVLSATALSEGHLCFVRGTPGHFVNVFLCSDRPILVDPTHIQFEVSSLMQKYDDDDDPIESATRELLLRAASNPYSAVKVQSLPPKPIEPLGRLPNPDDAMDLRWWEQHLQRVMKAPENAFERELMKTAKADF